MNKIKPSIKPKPNWSYDISVIIVCRNGKQVTENCLKGIQKTKVKEIIVIDNNSSDGTAQLLDLYSRKDKRFYIIHNAANNGFAEANNQGFKAATANFILFLNNDTEIDHDFIPPLLKSLKQSKVAAVQPMILFPDGTIDSIGSYLTPTGFLYHRAHRMKPNSNFLKEEPVYTLKGACMLWKRSVLEEIGQFNESYFAYFEETDLCHRAINVGYEVVYNPRSTITHLGGFTSNLMDQHFIQYHNTKNRITTYFCNLPLSLLLTMLPIHLLLSELLVFKTIFSKKLRLAWTIQKGLIEGVVTGILRRIRAISKPAVSLSIVMKRPSLKYYKALFSSLQGYTEIW
ncbi:MAG: glycosyltransferase family 2 protein [Patescibacteria group bacterium]